MPATRRSISSWVSCTGTADDTEGAAKAIAAARHGAFTLVVDCPVNIKIGSDIARPIFIDNGTSVEFTGSGKFTVDNVMIPAFVIADSTNINLVNWNVEYNGGISVTNVVGFVNNGQVSAGDKPGNAFNDIRLTEWLAANRGIVFDNAEGSVKSQWTGTTNNCAVFFLTGDTSNVVVTGMQLYAPKNAGGNRFIPVAFAVGVNFKANQTVTSRMSLTGQHFAVPHNLTFSNVSLDGTYMGWVGGVQDSVFENIESGRYGDLQDANGNNVGGIGKWFAPPHLFYFSYTVSGDTALYNTNIQIKNVKDNGIRIGRARDAAGTVERSGYALSMKLGCVYCSVDTYTSLRPDGLMDIFTSEYLTVSNVTAVYNSAFVNNLYPAWRFPSPSYKNLKFENITVTDSAPVSVNAPIGNANNTANENLVFTNVKAILNNWAGPESTPFPTITGSNNDVSLDYTILDRQLGEVASQVTSDNTSIEMQLRASPMTVRPGQSITLEWTSREASSCSLKGAVDGTGPNGLVIARMPSAAGAYPFTLTCASGNTTRSTALTVHVAS